MSQILLDNRANKVKRSDFDRTSFFAKQFCIPKQIKLVEYQSGRESKQNIQIVDRANHEDINPIFRQIMPIDFSSDHPDPGDGLISLVKELNIRLAICITVYTEDKTMLKRTLQGIRKNYQTFYQKAGIHSHEIVVVIMFDGIQYLNNSKLSDKNMFNLFREFDLINGFRKKQYLLAKNKEEQMYQEEQIQIEDDSMVNQIENFADQMVFTEEQYQLLESMLLEGQYIRYKSMSELLDFAQDIQNKKLQNMPIQSLPRVIKLAFMARARQYLQQNGVQDVTDNDRQLTQYLTQNFPQQKINMLKVDALKNSVILAKDYLKSRYNTAIMYQMALPLQQNKSGEQDPKMNLFTVVKYANRGKLSSHLWFFQGFCSMINPSVCILLDCGLETDKEAIFKVWSHIQTYKLTCGGVCGYMKLRPQSPFDQSGNRIQREAESVSSKISGCLFDVQKAQIFQYHLSHLLDKPFQSLTGYIHVLPGAFSGYNWDALKSQKFKVIRSDGHVFVKDIQKRTKQQILKKYLKTVIYNQVLDNIEQANMYLAQDRILCLQIYTKKKNQFNLQYLPDAYAFVDPITTLPRLLSQRKRWINGSWFALNYVLKNRGRVADSSHNCWEKFWFHFNMIHAEIMQMVSYIAISLFFVTLHLMVFEFAQTTLKNYFMYSYSIKQGQLVNAKLFYQFFSIRSVINSFTKIFDFFYICCLGILVYRSITIKRQDITAKRSFNTIATWLGVFGFVSIILIFANFYQAMFNNASELVIIRGLNGFFTQQTFVYLLMVIVGVHALVVISAFNCKTYYDILVSMFSYFFYVPSYVNLFMIYAFCRIDDLSWGTKGLDTQAKSKQAVIRRKFSDQKIRFAIKWLSINVVISLVLVGLATNYAIQNYIIWIFSAYFAIMLVIKLIFVIIYLLKYYILKKIKVALMVSRNKDKNRRDSLDNKAKIREFIDRLKQKSIDDHVDIINKQIQNKQIIQQNLQLQRQKIISQLVNNNQGMAINLDSRYKQQPVPQQNPTSRIQMQQQLSQARTSQLNNNYQSQLHSQNEETDNPRKKISFRKLKRISNVANAGVGATRSKIGGGDLGDN